MSDQAAAWVRAHVLDAYLDDGANAVHRWSRPAPDLDTGCQRTRPAYMLRAPRPYGPPDPRGEARPDLYHAVWVIFAPTVQHQADPVPELPGQLDLLTEVD